MSQYFPAKYPDRLYKARANQHRVLASGDLASDLYRNSVADTLPLLIKDKGSVRRTTPEDIFLAGKTGIGSGGMYANVLWMRVCESRFNKRGAAAKLTIPSIREAKR